MATRAILRAITGRIRQDEAGIYDTATRVNDLLNEGARDFSEQTRCLRQTYVGDLLTGTALPDLTAITPMVLEVLRVWVDDRELEYTPGDILARLPGYPTETGTPRYYTREMAGFPAIRLHPIPASDFEAQVSGGIVASSLYGGVVGITGLTGAQATSLYGGTAGVTVKSGGLRIEYIAQATDMVADSDKPSIPDEFHDALVWYAVARLHEDDVPISEQAKAPAYWAKYAAEVDRCMRLVNAGFQRKPSGSRRQSQVEWF